jgi:V8-like Glu-specific endopeptidase
MITKELVQQTEFRFEQRQGVRQEREHKIRTGSILEADTPDRVKLRIQHLARRAIDTEGTRAPTTGSSAPSDAAVLERILGKSDLMSMSYLEMGLRVARTVGRIHVRTADGAHAGYGTGFLVSPKLLITNNHVLEDAGVAGASRVEFNFQEGFDGKLMPSVFVNFDPSAFFATNKALDYTLVALKGELGSAAKFGWNGLSAAEGKIIVGEYVSIIQHPSGERKQLALRENQVIDVLPDFLHYRTDTSPGSSGSPVFNDQWEVVALHHSGVPRKDGEGRILTTDGTVWNRSMGEHRIQWIANEGVRISRILKNVQDLALSGTQAMLRKQLLETEKGWIAGTSSSESLGVLAPESGGGVSNSWTLPLQLTIEMRDGRIEPTSFLPQNGATYQHAASANISDKEQHLVGGDGTATNRADALLEWLANESETATEREML